MLYENYQNKIKKVAAVLSKIVKHLVLIIGVLSAVVVISVTLLATKGLTGAVKCESTLIYGEAFDCEAKAFLSDVRYEYAPRNSEEWSAERPVFPGEYKVRGVGISSTGKDRYGKPTNFTILPLAIKIRINETDVVFGDIPSIETDPLAYSDRISEYDVKFSDLKAESTSVSPDISAIMIVDREGNDVTSAYKFESDPSNISFVKRPIKVITQSSNKVYDGKPFTFDQYELGNGSTLGRNDNIVATFSSITDVGGIENKPELVIYHEENGVILDVTHQYDISIEAGQISVVQRPIVITTGSLTTNYTGKNIECLDFLVESEGLVEGHNVKVSSFGEKIDCGIYDNILDVSIVDQYGTDVIDNYSVLINKGTVEIIPVDITVTTESMSFVYDGKEHTCEKYSVTGVLQDQWTEADTFTTVKNVSRVANEVKINIFAHGDTDDLNVTKNYNITYQFGDLEVTPRSLEIITSSGTSEYGIIVEPAQYYSFEFNGLVEGHNAYADMSDYSFDGYPLTVGSYKNEFLVKVDDENGIDVTRNYDISYKYGTLTIEKRHITVRTADYYSVYDGNEHSCKQYIVIPEGSLISEHMIIVENSTIMTDAGKQSNKFSNYQIIDSRFDGDRADVTDNYDVKWEYGTIEIAKRPIYVVPEYTEKIYDDTPLYGGEVMLHHETPYDLVVGHHLEATTLGSRIDVGSDASSLSAVKVFSDSKEVTKNYDITTYNGEIVILPRPIVVETADDEKIYDGYPLVNHTYRISEESPYGIVKGHVLNMTVTGSQTEIGESDNTCQIESTRIMSRSKDVTANYEISYEFGLLEVKPYATVAVISASDFKYYDGKPLTNPEYEVKVIEGEINANHRLDVDVFGSIVDVGTVENELTVRVVDSRGRDVSQYYVVQPIPGTLTVGNKEDQEPPEHEIVFGQIKTDRGGYVYLKERSYGDFTGQNWMTAIPYSKTLSGGLGYGFLTSYALVNGNGNINFAEFKDLSLPMLPYYMGFDGDYIKPGSDVANLEQFGNFTMSFYSIPTTSDGFDYLKGNLREYSRYEEEYRNFVYKQYLTIDGTTLNYMNGLIKDQSFDKSDPNVILSVARYIQHAATYSLEYDPKLDHEDNVAIAFLETYKEGKCTHYATAATLLYRALGFPARYVEGFMVETQAGAFVDIKTPGHAWVEVYIDGVGWIYVEVTGSSSGSGTGGGGDVPKPEINIKPSYTYKVYDGEYLYPQQKVEADSLLSELISQGYSYDVVISGSRLEVGRSASVIESFMIYDPNGKDVTDQFTVNTSDGILEVFPKGQTIIKIYLYQLQKYYDGTPLKYGDDDYEIIYLPDGLTLKVSFNIEMTDVGALTLSDINRDIDSFITYRVYKGKDDVTKYYSLICDVFESTNESYVPIRVDSRYIEITSASENKVDNGKPLENAAVTITQGSLAGGHKLTAKAIGYIDFVGSVENTIDGHSISITDRDGNDVTWNYMIMIIPGTLTITDPDD